MKSYLLCLNLLIFLQNYIFTAAIAIRQDEIERLNKELLDAINANDPSKFKDLVKSSGHTSFKIHDKPALQHAFNIKKCLACAHVIKNNLLRNKSINPDLSDLDEDIPDSITKKLNIYWLKELILTRETFINVVYLI